jgi:phosphatidylglycerophosphate synthase
MAEVLSFRRVLIVADGSADWMVAGLRQLERLVLSVDEFALENKETAPVLVCIVWRPDVDQSQRWVPKNERLTMVAFTNTLDGEPFDLVLSTRLFLYRKALGQLLSEGRASARPITSEQALIEIEDVRKHIPPGEKEFWESCFRQVEALPSSRAGAWEYIADGEQIDGIEIKFLRGSGKSQDGFVSRYLNRPISRVVTRLLLRFPTTPNAWTLLIFLIPLAAALTLLQGAYWSFLWGLVLFQVFSVLDGCDGEIARAKFLESERGRRLDDLFDILSNILLVAALGFGLSRQASLAGHSSWFCVVEGLVAAALITANEAYLAARRPSWDEAMPAPLGAALYPRHRELVERSGILLFGEKFASWLIQLTKRDVAMLFFVFLAAIGQPAWILHLLLGVAAISLALALKASAGGRAG